MSTHGQIDPAKRRAVRGRPKTVIGGKRVATSIYLSEEYVAMIEEFRQRHGLRSTSDAHREIIKLWAGK